MASITPGGDSRGWLQSGENTKRIFELFSAQDDELDGTDWDSVPETTLCSEEVYERMAHWLVHTYVSPPGTKNAGEPIADSTLCNYMSRLINFAATKFRAKSLIPATKDFFACLDAGSQQPSAKWLRGMKAKIQKIHFERAVKKGDNLDKSECERRPMRPPTSPSPPCPLLQGALGLPCQACRGLYSLMMAFVRWISPPQDPCPSHA